MTKAATASPPTPTGPCLSSAAALGDGREHYFDLINQIVVGITLLFAATSELSLHRPHSCHSDRPPRGATSRGPAGGPTAWERGTALAPLTTEPRARRRTRRAGQQMVRDKIAWLLLPHRSNGPALRREDSLLMTQLKVLQTIMTSAPRRSSVRNSAASPKHAPVTPRPHRRYRNAPRLALRTSAPALPKPARSSRCPGL